MSPSTKKIKPMRVYPTRFRERTIAAVEKLAEKAEKHPTTYIRELVERHVEEASRD